jgi:long-chain acyl-CoA synthetase
VQFDNAPAPSLNLESMPSALHVFNDAVDQFAGRTAFQNFGVELTYQDLSDRANRVAAFLQKERGVKAGDKFAVMLPNTLQYPIFALALMRIGAVLVNVNPLYTPRELTHQLNDSGAVGIIVLANMAETVEACGSDISLKTVIVTELADAMPQPKRLLLNLAVKYLKKMVPAYSLPGHIKFTDVLGRSDAQFEMANPGHDDIIALQYTGGTTGVSKGAVLTHRNVLSNMAQIDRVFDGKIKPGMVAIAPLPLYHVFAFVGHMMWLFKCGAKSVLITNPRDMPTFMGILEKNPCDIFIGLNTLFVGLLKQPRFRALDFSNLFLTVSGGMALTRSTAEEWESLTGCSICEGYGLTETSPVVSVNPPEGIQLGTIGTPLADTEIKILDEDGSELPVGGVGELAVRGPQVMRGYWQRDEATAEVMTPDGFFKTGDMAVALEDGYYKIVDRKKDMILVSGFNVYPNEVEDVLASHPRVTESAVVGVPNEEQGESVKAYLVADGELSVEELDAWCRERLTAYKVPKAFEFRDELPKTNVGKVLRRALR